MESLKQDVSVDKSQELVQKVKENPEKALERLKSIDMKLNMEKESLEKEINTIKQKAIQEDNEELLDLIEKVENTDSEEELDKIKDEILVEEKEIMAEMTKLFQTESLIIREIYNEYGM